MMRVTLERYKKKVVYGLLSAVVICSFMIVGCGSKNADELIDDATQMIEESEMENLVIAETAGKEAAVEESIDEETVIEEVENAVPEWYLDEAGLKNDQLGVVVKKDNDFLDVLRICTTLSVEGKMLDFYCSYNDSDLDEYILQRPEMRKGKIENTEYAYDDQNVVFIGNGVEISSNYFFWGLDEGISITEWIEESNIVTQIDTPIMNCLAYNTKDGLYCPALGIALCEDGIASVGAQYYYETDNYDYAEVNFKDYVDGAVVGSAKNANEAAENYKNYFIEYGLNLLDGSIEFDLGNDHLIGVGFDREDMCFSELYPDSLEYCVSLNFSDKQTCEEALTCIEAVD